jgi:two-component system, cell cycle sensor histidine kinase and response regulator CckA
MNLKKCYSTERIGEPHTVLVVDDEAPVRSYQAQLLASQGYNVLEAESGAEALRLAGTATIHLLLTDLLMPDINGLELTRKFRAAHPRTPVLMVSGSLPPTEIRTENLAPFDFLPKPFVFEELVQKVRALLDAETPFPIRKG